MDYKANRTWPLLVPMWSGRWAVSQLAIFAFHAKDRS
jgi:hypothetical protein